MYCSNMIICNSFLFEASNLALSNDMRRVYRSYASINVGFDDIIDDEDYQDETGGPQDTTRDEGGDAVGLHSNMGAHGDGGRARRAVGSTSQPHSQGIRTVKVYTLFSKEQNNVDLSLNYFYSCFFLLQFSISCFVTKSLLYGKDCSFTLYCRQ